MKRYNYLTEYLESIGYTKDEALETEIRFENGMEIPEEVRKDVTEYHNILEWERKMKINENVKKRN